MDNMVSIDSKTHSKITGYYNSIQEFTDGKTVREWLKGQSYEKQYKFGYDYLKEIGAIK